MKIETSFVPCVHMPSERVFALLHSGNIDPRDAASEIILLMRATAHSPISSERQ